VLFAQPFDADRQALVGDPVRVLPGVSFNAQNGRGGFDASANGAIVARPGEDLAAGWNLRLLSRDGQLVKPFDDAGRALGPALSPDGTRVAFHRMEVGGGDVCMLDLAGSVQHRFTFDRSQENASPLWSPDGTRIVFRSRRGAGRELYFLRPVATATSEVGGLVRTGSDLRAAMAVDVRSAGAGLEFGPPRRLFEAPGVFGGLAGYFGNYIAWAVSGDGQRFFLQQPVATERQGGLAPLVVILNHPALRPRQ
jgi:dipeptidyl aminopeptidase/acylaminoacyl peptidase